MTMFLKKEKAQGKSFMASKTVFGDIMSLEEKEEKEKVQEGQAGRGTPKGTSPRG